MRPKTVKTICFSPTGTTARVARTVGEALARALDAPFSLTDWTRPADRACPVQMEGTDLAVCAFPTYAGKLPNKILPDLRENLRGNHTPAVCVVTYGNRAFDNSLAELVKTLTDGGFLPIAAAAFVSRHAFTDALGTGRPDWDDLREAEDFARAAAEKLLACSGETPVRIPGDADAPYYVPRGRDGAPAAFLRARPLTDLSRCSQCGTCARVCPMGAIDPEDVSRVPGTCIKCQACVRRCTRRAKYFDDPAFLSHVAMLEETFTEPKRNQMFL